MMINNSMASYCQSRKEFSPTIKIGIYSDVFRQSNATGKSDMTISTTAFPKPRQVRVFFLLASIIIQNYFRLEEQFLVDRVFR